MSEEDDAAFAPGRVVHLHRGLFGVRPWVVSSSDSLSEDHIILLVFLRVTSVLGLLVALTLRRVLLIRILLVSSSEALIISVIALLLTKNIKLLLILFVALAGITSSGATEHLVLLLLFIGRLASAIVLVTRVHVVLFQGGWFIRRRILLECQTELTLASRRIVYFNWSSIVSSIRRSLSIAMLLAVLLLTVASLAASVLVDGFGGSSCILNVLRRHVAVVTIVSLLLVRRLVGVDLILVPFLESVVLITLAGIVVPANAPLGVAA